MGDARATARVLVVDDDGATRRLLRRQLEAAGHVVVEAVDLESAAAALASADVDLVLLDLNLGAQSGLELFERPGVTMPATLVLSGAGEETAAQRSRAAGAVDFLRKPVAGAALRERVRVALSGRRRLRPIEARLGEPRPLPADPRSH